MSLRRRLHHRNTGREWDGPPLNVDIPQENNESQAVPFEESLSPASIVLFFLFGFIILFIIFNLHLMTKRRLRQEERDQETRENEDAENRLQSKQRRRNRFNRIIRSNHLSETLTASHFRSCSLVEDNDSTMIQSSVNDLSNGSFCVKESKSSESSETTASATTSPSVDLSSTGEATGIPTADEHHNSHSVPTATEPETCPSSPMQNNNNNAHVVIVSTSTPQGPELTFPNLCAICLDPYQEESTIVWSNNPSCLHAFHKDCILDYLVLNKEEDPPCPCCRRTFLTKAVWRRKGGE